MTYLCTKKAMHLPVKILILISVVYPGNLCAANAQRNLFDLSHEHRILQKTKNNIPGCPNNSLDFFSELTPLTLYKDLEHVATNYDPLPESNFIEHRLKPNPEKLWNLRAVQLNISNTPISHSPCLISPNSDCRRKKEQILFTTLRYYAGINNLNTALKVTLFGRKGGTSIGTQKLRFIESEDGGTVIEHVRHNQSNSKLSDKPLFHIHTLP